MRDSFHIFFLLQKFEDSQKMDRCLGRVVSVKVMTLCLTYSALLHLALVLHVQVCEHRTLHQVGPDTL